MARIAFVQNIVFEYLGTEYLASHLKKNGHEVELFLISNLKKSLKQLYRFQPDLIGFSCTTGIHRWALNVASELKEKLKTRIIFGGPHPTFFPEIIENKAIDFICIGEGESAITELADRVDSKEDIKDIENIWVRCGDGQIIKNPVRPLIQNIDKLPFPDRKIYYRKYPFLNRSQKHFLAGRGCPFSCTFCFNHALKNIYKGKGNYIRLRSPSNLIDEIKNVHNEFGLRTVYLQDDTILYNKSWLIEFLKIYRNEINLPFICLVRADLMDDEIAYELKKSNCYSVFFGVETGDEDRRNRLLKKNISDSQIMGTVRLLKRHKIKFRTYNMLGLPGEELKHAFKTVELNIKIKTDYPWCSLFIPYPRTELGEYALDNGLVDGDFDKANHSFFYRSNMRLKNQKEISNLQKLFFYAVKFPALFPLIKKIIKIRPNLLFDFSFLFSYAIAYLKSENLSFKDLFNTAKYNARSFFFNAD